MADLRYEQCGITVQQKLFTYASKGLGLGGWEGEHHLAFETLVMTCSMGVLKRAT